MDEKKMNWISVKDQLPEQMRLLLICYSSDLFGNNATITERSMRIGNKWNSAIYFDDAFLYICKADEDIEFKNVTHWMYWSNIPQPTK